HRHAQRAERVLDADRAGVGLEDLRKALVGLRCLVGPAADQDDALVAKLGTDCVPVNAAGADELLGVDLPHLGVRMVRTPFAVVVPGRHRPGAIAHGALVHLAASYAARGLRSAHHPAGPEDGRVERLLRALSLETLEDDRVLAHRCADESLLARTRRSAAL